MNKTTKSVIRKPEPQSPLRDSGGHSMWGGRFETTTADSMRQLNSSIHVDKRLYRQDIQASIAHATMLGEQAIITQQEAETIIAGLKAIEQEISNGQMVMTDELEDIHLHIEHRLTELIGAVGGKLHTARSRNDQVITDTKIWLRQELQVVYQQTLQLRQDLLQRATLVVDVILPGFTHLQPAQPISLAHYLLAYYEMFLRDSKRFAQWFLIHDECPLGSAALAGTGFPINRHRTAELLEFKSPSHNSLDSVSARDFILDFLAAASMHAGNLSRMAEEIVLWSSPAFNFIRLSDKFSTGSSIMPQKRNPDAAELVRAKAVNILSQFQKLSTIIIALPLGYAKDLQEDKTALFAAVDDLLLCQSAMIGMIKDMEFLTEDMQSALAVGYLTATDLADQLVLELGYPFRQAHHLAGRAVAMAEKLGVALDQLKPEDWKKIDSRIEKDLLQRILPKLQPTGSVDAKTSYGGTARVEVKKQIAKATAELQMELKSGIKK